MANVLIFGASGNLGTSLLASLEADPEIDELVGVARRLPTEAPFTRTRWVAADIARDGLDALFTGIDVVVHLAWLIQPSHDEALLDRVNVEGTGRILEAAARAGTPTVVFGSSVGAYAPGASGDRRVDESWSTGGIEGNLYSEQKARAERLVDEFEAEHPATRVVRMRPALIFKRDSASHVRRLFLGPFVPQALLAPGRIPFLPDIPGMVTQAVHADDVADAYRRVILSPDVRGAFNLAAEPLLTSEAMARALDTRTMPVGRGVARGIAEAVWRVHLQPTPGSWIELAVRSPLLDAGRARSELGWEPRTTATAALRELVEGIHDGASFPTPPLQDASPHRGLRRIRDGVGVADETRD
ncbi:MAG: NAD-dependent epimerase [Thermoleophilia bacterium]|nr:NAD-dependent epimerase [Thermoleophilia bacterium]